MVADSSAPAASSARPLLNPFLEREDVGSLNVGCVHLASMAIEDAGKRERDLRECPFNIIFGTGRGAPAKSILNNLFYSRTGGTASSAEDAPHKSIGFDIIWHTQEDAHLIVGARNSTCRKLEHYETYRGADDGAKWHAFATVVKLATPWCGQAHLTVMAVDVIKDTNARGLGDGVATAIATAVTVGDVRVIGGFFGKSLGRILEAVRTQGVDLNVAAWRPCMVNGRSFAHPVYTLAAAPTKVAEHLSHNS